MKKLFALIFLSLFLALSFFYIGKNFSQKEISKQEFTNSSKSDTLKFTSGIRSIFEDSKGNYWFGSLQEGVGVFDGTSFSYFTTKEGLTDNQILSIQEDKSGIIWFGTGRGVSSYDGKNITNHPLIAGGSLLNKWIKKDTDLWFSAGNNEGIYRYDGKNFNYLAFPSPKIINPKNVYFVTGLSEGKNDMLWIGTYAGIFGYDGKQFTVINDETLKLNNETGVLHIRSILEDSKGRLWIGNNGIGVLLKDGDTTFNFSEKNNLIHPTSSRRGDKSEAGTLEHVFTIEEDADGNIWFGDRDTGIWKFDGNTMSNYTKNAELTNDFAQAIYKDKNNELWFGMSDGSVFKFNGETFEQQF